MFQFLQWYILRFSFPHRGWKYLLAYMSPTGLHKRNFVKKIFNGSLMSLVPEDHVQQYLFWYGIYENETAKTFLQTVKATDCVLDIGANVGYYSVLAASIAKSVSVYAFEPNAVLHVQILESARLNTFANIKIVPNAVSDVHLQELDLYLSDADNKGMSALEKPENYSGVSKNVIAITIDEWIKTQSIQTVNVIKMDIEGAELKALHGMKNTLMQHKPILFVELCEDTLSRFQVSGKAVFEFITNLGYDAFEMQANNKLQKMEMYFETADFNILFKPK